MTISIQTILLICVLIQEVQIIFLNRKISELDVLTSAIMYDKIKTVVLSFSDENEEEDEAGEE